MKKIFSISVMMLFVFGLTGCEKINTSKIQDAQNIANSAQNSIEEIKNNAEDIVENKINTQKDVESNVKEGAKDKKIDAQEETISTPAPQKTLLILDASGSMWGKINAKAKIDIAKDVVKSTVKNFQDTELGLMVYGHRRKGDCKDIEILTAPKKNNAQNISQMVDKISPKGMTPMGDAVLMAAESLKYTEQKATVILVSDGIETCDVDLCALGKKLEEAGVDFTAHVIGFDMTEQQTAGLKCLATETGGTFTSAKNADDLSRALEETVEAASCSKEKLGEAVVSVPEQVNVNEKFTVTWTGPSQHHDAIGLFPKDATDWNNHLKIFSYLDSKKGVGELTAPTKEGSYDVVYFADCGEILGRASLMVKSVSVLLSIPETVTVGSDMTISWTGPNNHNDDIGIFPVGATDWNDHLKTFSYLDSKKGAGTLTAPLTAGKYDVVYWLGGEEILARETFIVTDAVASIDKLPNSVKKGTKFSIEWTGPKNTGNAITILPNGSSKWNDHVGGNLYHINGNDSKGVLIAPNNVGEYDVVYWLKGNKILDRKTIIVID